MVGSAELTKNFRFFSETEADEFVRGDLRSSDFCQKIVDHRFDEVYQLAADMGGAGYIFIGAHDADIMHNSATINLNMLDVCSKRNIPRVFYSSSACMYPAYNQEDPGNPLCVESPPIQLHRTVSMDGRSFFPSAFTLPTTATMGC